MTFPKELEIRSSTEADAAKLTECFQDPNILLWFPMDGQKEIEDSVRIWMDSVKKGAGVTALWNGEPCGMSVLYIQQFESLKHTCLLSIIIEDGKRGKGIGTALLTELIDLAKNRFHIEILHLEVYDGNPARHLYERLGFTPFGSQENFTKEGGKSRKKVFMEKYLA